MLRTGEACEALGAAIERLGPGRWRIRGPGLGALLAPPRDARFRQRRHRLAADDGRRRRPRDHRDLRRRRLAAQTPDGPHSRSAAADGGRGSREAEGGRCPIVLKGARDPAPILYRTPVASAQIKSAVLLAGLNARGVTTVVEAEASRDHTEKMLAHFGAEVTVTAEGEGRRIDLVGRPELRPAGRRSGRSVFGGVSDRRRADRPGLRHRRRGRDDEPAALGAADDAPRDGRRHRDPRPARRGRRGGGGPEGARERAQGRRRAGRARALDDRRISDPRGRRVLRLGDDADARPARIARQGERPSRRGRRGPCGGRRRACDRRRRPRRRRRGPPAAGDSSRPIWITASR